MVWDHTGKLVYANPAAARIVGYPTVDALLTAAPAELMRRFELFDEDGPRIAPDMLSRIFELFVQAPQTIDRSRGGLGLGLTIVQSLVSSFGGTVSAQPPGQAGAARSSSVCRTSTPRSPRARRPLRSPCDTCLPGSASSWSTTTPTLWR